MFQNNQMSQLQETKISHATQRRERI